MGEFKLSKLAALSLCLTSFLAIPVANAAYNNPGVVRIDLTGGWFGDSVYDGGYGILAPTSTTSLPSGEFLKVESHRDFAGGLGLTYFFPASPYSINLSYWGIHDDSSDGASGFIGVTKAPADWGIDFAGGASSEVDLKNDFLKLAFAVTMNPVCNFRVTPQVGVAYLRIKNDQTTFYSGDGVTPAGAVIAINENSSFRGVGPTFGINLDYGLKCGFGIFGDFNFSALVGNLKSSYAASHSGSPTINTTVSTETDDNIVNLFQTEVGLSYLFQVKHYPGKIMLGYAVAKALSASENNSHFIDDVNDSKYMTSVTDVGFQGPFARISLAFDV